MINYDEIKKLEKTLSDLSKKSVPFVLSKTLNNMAFEASVIAKKKIKRNFITRNTWSERSIKYGRATKQHLQSEVGSTEDYMRKQEFGGTEKKNGKLGVAVPTAKASNETSTPRKKLIRKANKIQSIKINKTKIKDGWGSAYAQAESGAKFVTLTNDDRKGSRSNSKGIFAVKKGSKKKPFKFKKIHDLSNKSITINKNPWLEPTLKIIPKIAPRLYYKNLKDEIENQIKRAGLKS